MGLESKVAIGGEVQGEPAIDREKVKYIYKTYLLSIDNYLNMFNQTCPLLLRVFCNLSGRHNAKTDYNRGFPSNELQIYTWYLFFFQFLLNQTISKHKEY